MANKNIIYDRQRNGFEFFYVVAETDGEKNAQTRTRSHWAIYFVEKKKKGSDKDCIIYVARNEFWMLPNSLRYSRIPRTGSAVIDRVSLTFVWQHESPWRGVRDETRHVIVYTVIIFTRQRIIQSRCSATSPTTVRLRRRINRFSPRYCRLRPCAVILLLFVFFFWGRGHKWVAFLLACSRSNADRRRIFTIFLSPL